MLGVWGNRIRGTGNEGREGGRKGEKGGRWMMDWQARKHGDC